MKRRRLNDDDHNHQECRNSNIENNVHHQEEEEKEQETSSDLPRREFDLSVYKGQTHLLDLIDKKELDTVMDILNNRRLMTQQQNQN